MLQLLHGCFLPYCEWQTHLERTLLVRHRPPQRVNPEEGTCEPGETRRPQRGRLTGLVEKERRVKSQPPAPKKWIYKGYYTSVSSFPTFRNIKLVIFAAADIIHTT